MSNQGKKYLKFGAVTVVILLSMGYLAYTGVQESKSYYVTIKELQTMGDGAYSKRLRVAGNVQPGSIRRNGTHVEFVLMEQGQSLPVSYSGTEPPPDTFKDNDGVIHAKGIQAKCASKYAPQQPGSPSSAPASESPRSMTQATVPGASTTAQ
jgi:cytochrome c-type biogenesis protein CcmE